MFDIHKITLNNFKSYYRAQHFVFPTEAGLYFLTGQNSSNTRLGANGAGKSTLLDAINWCFFGKTSRGLKASDIISWGETTASVSVELTVGDQHLKVTRTQSPNSLIVNGTTVEQHTLDKLLRLNQSSFGLAVAMPQFGESFFDLSATAKLGVLSDVLELDYWLVNSQKADAAAKVITAKISPLERFIDTADSQIESLNEDVQSLQSKSDGFEQEKQQTVLAMQSKMQGCEAQINAALEEEFQLKPGRIPKDLQAQIAKANAELSNLQVAEAKFGRLKGVCPTCEQEVDTQHIKTEIAAIKAKIVEIGGKLQSLKDLQSAAKRLDVVRADLNRLEERYGEFETRIKAEKSCTNPYQQLIIEKQTSLIKVTETLDTKKAALGDLQAQYAATVYWVSGFKKIRLYVIDEVLRDLELEVNSNLASLGLADWRIGFDIERENKSGGVTKGFTVLVYSPNNAHPVPYSAWSGGEGQLLRLAGALGLANLIMSRVGLTGMVEFYDEPSTHLSQEGMLNLAETLHQRAILNSKKVWLVDHSAINFGDFAATITVVKDGAGSRLQHRP